ncbi:hydroquinone glucosyltransferase-like [Abrus precatorius]|uniref:Glycosyltransferase n=1 Tax=Abrus precatorius TaxID=3816 RepID=A0A8B8L316_ABRPR|nr:hydroquinone glucosyltransferase-like [Abrus precatorius]
MEIQKEEARVAPVMVAMLPSPGMGHLIPMIEFAKRVVGYHNLEVTFVIPTDGPPSKAQTTVLQALPKSISHTFLPPVSLSDLPPDSKIETLISLTVLRSLPSLRHAFRSLSATHTVAALVVDLFGTDAFDVAAEFNASPYVFYPSTAMALSVFLHLPRLHQEVQCEYRELPEPVKIPGCVPVEGKDLLDPVQDRKNEAYKWVLHHAKRYAEAEGIIENSFLELEPGAVKELLKGEPGKPPFYPVGPLVNMESGGRGERGSECLRWLEEQPHGSVLFVSFGSGGTLSSAQLNELALGLEMSEQRFLWVVRSPNDKVANASYFIAESHVDPFGFLPKGFLERTKGRGLVVSSWAPQPQVLAHGSTGGFLTHCGWNSILESVVNGVPLVAWPLFAEQKMNAVMLTHDIKVALRPTVGDNGLVQRQDIASVVKCLMEGEEGKKLRYRMKDLKEAAAKALAPNGSSTNHISNLALKWTNKPNVTN